jgi:hypothetical protein
MNYREHVEVLRARRADLAAEVAGFTVVTSVMQWMQARGLTQTTVDIIGQDEFEYDFVVRVGSDEEWLVFGLT